MIIFVNCDADNPMNFTASRDEVAARFESTGGGYHPPKEITLNDGHEGRDRLDDAWSACDGDDLSNELLCAAWELAHFRASLDFLRKERLVTEAVVAEWFSGKGFEPWPAEWFRGSDFYRHGNDFCRMVGLACGAAAEAAQRSVLAAEMAAVK